VSASRLRPIEPGDAHAVYTVFRRSLAALLEQYGDAWPWEPQADADTWEQWQPLFEHLQAECDLAWLAQVDREVVGYARSLRRGTTRELTEFFVLPEEAGRGLGRQLLEAAFPAREGEDRVVIATLDPSAQSRYIRAGLRAHTTLAELTGAPDPTRVPHDLEVRPVDAGSQADLDAIASIDLATVRARRDAEHRWFATHRAGLLFLRAGRPVGYGWVTSWAGPVAALEPDDLPAMIAELERVAAEAGIGELGWNVPLTAHTAAVHLLSRGYRLDRFPVLLMSDGPELPGRFDRYLVTSPPFIA
jgi:GNAT superfamily N-acetyltransferase